MSSLITVLHYLLTIFGIGLVIFVHELGHYMAARAVGIRVEAFSIGFGPRLLGFRRGGTDYKLCLIPLGGFVKMAGEDPTEGRTGAGDEFGSKSIPARILVITAGVIMNVVFACVALPVAFMMGVPFEAPVLGSVTAGGAAWRSGLREGDRIRAVDGVECLSFEDAVLGYATGGDAVRMTIERAGKTFDVSLSPVREASAGRPDLGVRGRTEPFVLAAEAADANLPEDKPAGHRARHGLRPGDVLVAIDDLPFGLWRAEGMQSELRRLVPRKLRVRRGDVESEILLPPLSTPSDEPPSFGLEQAGLAVAAVGADSFAAKAGMKVGDRVVAVDDRPVARPADLRRAFASGALKLRIASPTGELREIASEDPALRRSFTDDVHFEVEASRLSPRPGGPAEAAGASPGDRLVSVDGKHATFEDLRALPASDKPFAVAVQRTTNNISAETILPLSRGPIAINSAFADLGAPKIYYETVKASFGDAWSKGAAHTVAMTRRVLQTIRSIFNRRVSADNLGGIITIFRSSVASTEVAPSRGLLFLAFISLNLAVLNILPIPVLDGGWLMFLLIEAVRRKPLSERVMAVFQWIGFLLVMGLMVYVTWNDIARLIKTKFG